MHCLVRPGGNASDSNVVAISLRQRPAFAAVTRNLARQLIQPHRGSKCESCAMDRPVITVSSPPERALEGRAGDSGIHRAPNMGVVPPRGSQRSRCSPGPLALTPVSCNSHRCAGSTGREFEVAVRAASPRDFFPHSKPASRRASARADAVRSCPSVPRHQAERRCCTRNPRSRLFGGRSATVLRRRATPSSRRATFNCRARRDRSG